MGSDIWIPHMDFLYGFSIWIQRMAPLFPCHVCIPCMNPIHAISLWIRYMHLVHGLNVWIEYMDSPRRFLMCIQHIDSTYRFSICIPHMHYLRALSMEALYGFNLGFNMCIQITYYTRPLVLTCFVTREKKGREKNWKIRISWGVAPRASGSIPIKIDHFQFRIN